MKITILRGIPGSGKSTYQKRHWPNAFVCSADDFFLDGEGNYNFNPQRLGWAHSDCLKKFALIVTRVGNPDLEVIANPEVLVVDNTNIFAHEIAPYYELAKAFGFPVEIHTIRCNPDIAAARNKHGVSRKEIRKMAQQLKGQGLPEYWNKLWIYTDC